MTGIGDNAKCQVELAFMRRLLDDYSTSRKEGDNFQG